MRTQTQVRYTLRESSDRFVFYCCPECRQSWDKPQMHSCGLEVHGPSVQLQYNLKHCHKGKVHSDFLPQGRIQHIHIKQSWESWLWLIMFLWNCIYHVVFLEEMSICQLMSFILWSTFSCPHYIWQNIKHFQRW